MTSVAAYIKELCLINIAHRDGLRAVRGRQGNQTHGTAGDPRAPSVIRRGGVSLSRMTINLRVLCTHTRATGESGRPLSIGSLKINTDISLSRRTGGVGALLPAAFERATRYSNTNRGTRCRKRNKTKHVCTGVRQFFLSFYFLTLTN